MTVAERALVPRVSVIIPHYSDLGGLALCLASLDRQTYPRDQFEIIVADNNSPGGPAAVAEVIAGRARLEVVTEKGAGPARNGGVAVSRGEILAFIDSDCVAEPEWLQEALEGLEGFDFIGGRVKVLVADPGRITPEEAFERVFAFDFKTYIEKKRFTGAGNLVCPRSVFDTTGGFGVGVSEDVDWSRRAQACGFRLGYAPRAVVGHPARRSWPELLAKWRRVNLETFTLAMRRKHGRLLWLAKALLMPVSAVIHAVKVLRSPELNSMAERWGALTVLFRLRFWRLGDSVRLLRSQA
jgi:GT2 family glycosyltransferase